MSTTTRKSTAGPRLSIEPLLGTLAANHIELEFLDARLNNSLRQAKYRGYMTLAMADDIACHILKMHPVEVWGAEYEEACWADGDDLRNTYLEAGMADVKVRRAA